MDPLISEIADVRHQMSVIPSDIVSLAIFSFSYKHVFVLNSRL